MYRLMVKTHNVTGLKYLCITTKDDYESYTGSGKYWIRHLKVHGFDYSTEVLFEAEEKTDEFITTCKYYSNIFNVVESDEWANLVIENGNDGSLSFIPTDEQRKHKSKVLTEYYKNNPDKVEEIRRNVKKYYKENPEVRENISNKVKSKFEDKEWYDFWYKRNLESVKNRPKEIYIEAGKKISETKLNWSEEKRREVYDKVKETKKTSESWHSFVDEMKDARQGSGNPNAKGCVFEGVEFKTMTAFREYIKHSDISLNEAFNQLDDPENKNSYRLQKKKERKTITCNVCGKQGSDSPVFKRWHFNNCKENKEK